MKVLITGYPGWLANYVINYLVNGSKDYPDYKPNKYEVKVMIYDKCGMDLHKVLDPLKITDEDMINFTWGDVTNYNDCLEATKDIDAVVHIAGIIHPKKVKDYFMINTRGTDNMIRASVANGVKKFIYISSNSACGVKNYAMTEVTVENPYMNYGKSKKEAEDIINEQCILHNTTKGIILRPCWFYGEGQPDRQTKLFKMIKKGKPMIFGDGNNLRSMSYVGNTSRAIQLALDREIVDYTDVETFWIADENAYSTIDIYKEIGKLFGVEIKPRHIPSIACTVGRIGDKILQKLGKYNQYVHVLGEMDENIACDITYAKEKLGYDPKVSLVEGMKRSIDWCKQNGKL